MQGLEATLYSMTLVDKRIHFYDIYNTLPRMIGPINIVVTVCSSRGTDLFPLFQLVAIFKNFD